MTNIPDLASMFNPNADFKANNEAASNFLAEDPEMGLSANSISKAVEANKISSWGGANAGEATQATEGGGGGTATGPTEAEAPKTKGEFDLETYMIDARKRYKDDIIATKGSGRLDQVFQDKIKKDIMTYEGISDVEDGMRGMSEIGRTKYRNVLEQISTGEGFKAEYTASTEYIDRGQQGDTAKIAEVKQKNEQIKASNAIMEKTFQQDLQESVAVRSQNQAKLDKLKSYLPEGTNPQRAEISMIGVDGVDVRYTPRIEMPAREPVYTPLLDETMGAGKSKLMTKDWSGGEKKDAPNYGPPRAQQGDHDVWGNVAKGVTTGTNGDYLQSLKGIRPSEAQEHFTTGASAAITNAFQTKADKNNLKEFDMSLWNNVMGDGFAKSGDDVAGTGRKAVAKLSAEAGFQKFYKKDGTIDRQATAKTFATNGNNVLLTIKDKNGKWVEAEIPSNVNGMSFSTAGIKKLNKEYGLSLKEGATWKDLLKTKNAEYRVNSTKYEDFTKKVSSVTERKLQNSKLDGNAQHALKNNLNGLTTISLINGLRYVD